MKEQEKKKEKKNEIKREKNESQSYRITIN